MKDETKQIQVAHMGSGMMPRSFRWQGRVLRVRAIDWVKVAGLERRYRVRTVEGHFELGLLSDSGTWSLRKTPTRLGKMWDTFQHPPRYPLSLRGRRRPRPANRTQSRPSVVADEPGAAHIKRLVLVR